MKKWIALMVAGALLVPVARAVAVVCPGETVRLEFERPDLPVLPSVSWLAGNGAPVVIELDPHGREVVGTPIPLDRGSVGFDVTNVGGDLLGPTGVLLNGPGESGSAELQACWMFTYYRKIPAPCDWLIGGWEGAPDPVSIRVRMVGEIDAPPCTVSPC